MEAEGKKRLSPPGRFLGASGFFFIEAFIYLFIYYFWGLILPPPHLPARTHQVGATSCAWGWGPCIGRKDREL